MSLTPATTGPPPGLPPDPEDPGTEWRENRGLLALILGIILAAFGLLFFFLIWSPFDQDNGDQADDQAQVDVEEDPDRAPAGPTGDSVVIGSADALRCPVMTDSIERLYLAYFERRPNDAEFSRWTARYQTGQETLQSIAQQLAESAQFSQRYGELDNGPFVDRLYRNAIGAAPNPEDRDVWIRSLDDGLSRGAVTVAMTESQRAVEVSRTTTPMAGFLRQYPPGTHWYCGTGPRDDLPIKPLIETTVYADYMFHNGGQEDSPAGIRTVIGGGNHLTLASGSIPPGLTSYRWNGRFDGDGNYGSAIDVEAGPATWWVLVFYPSSIGEGRLGWQIGT